MAKALGTFGYALSVGRWITGEITDGIQPASLEYIDDTVDKPSPEIPTHAEVGQFYQYDSAMRAPVGRSTRMETPARYTSR